MKKKETFTSAIGEEFEECSRSDLFLSREDCHPVLDQKFFIPLKPQDDQLEFPVNDEFIDLITRVRPGTIIHSVDRQKEFPEPILPSDNSPQNRAAQVYEKGFLARDLSVFVELEWYGECDGVIRAHGWLDSGGNLSTHILEGVRERHGPQSIDFAKKRYAENWEFYVGELASIDLVKPLSRLWYCVNMMALYYCHRDDLRFGFLWAEYQYRMRDEKTTVRGATISKAASAGGKSRRTSHDVKRTQVLTAMATHLKQGHTASRAADLAWRGVIGTSAAANRKIWQRHQKRE